MASVDFIDYSKIILNNGYFSSFAGEGDKCYHTVNSNLNKNIVRGLSKTTIGRYCLTSKCKTVIDFLDLDI